MDTFKTLFGVEPSAIQKTCVVVPFLMQGAVRAFGIEKLKKGMIYATANTETFTFLKAGIGAALTGDAILYLEQTNCQNIIFFGSCGLAQETPLLSIGSLVCPGECLSFEGFTDVLLRQTGNIRIQRPDQTLHQAFLNGDPVKNIQPVRGISVGSLKCEASYLQFFCDKGIEVIDLECSAVFSAAQHIQRKAVALLYATDVPGTKPFFRPLESEDKRKIDNAVQTACKAIAYVAKVEHKGLTGF